MFLKSPFDNFSNNIFYAADENAWMWQDEGPGKVNIDVIADVIGNAGTLNGGFVNTTPTSVIDGLNSIQDPSVWHI